VHDVLPVDDRRTANLDNAFAAHNSASAPLVSVVCEDRMLRNGFRWAPVKFQFNLEVLT